MIKSTVNAPLKPVLVACFTLIISVTLLWFSSVASSQRIIRVGIFQNEPIIFKTPQGVAKGLYADILNAVAKEEGWQIDYVSDSWDGCLSRLRNGDIDLMTSIAYTLERDAYADFSHEVVWTLWGTVFLPLGSTIDHITDMQGKKIAILKNEINGLNFMRLIKQFKVQCEVLELSSYNEIMRRVEDGEFDAGVINSVFGTRHADQYRLTRSSIIFSPVSARFAVIEGRNSDLLAVIDKHLHGWKLDAKSPYQRSLNKWILAEPEKVFVIPAWVYLTILSTLLLALLLLTWTRNLKRVVGQRVKELKASEERFRTVVNTIPELIWLKDCEGVYLSCNRMFERFFGEKVGNIVGKTDYDFVDKELANLFRQNDLLAIKTGGPHHNEEWVTFADDGYHCLLDTTKVPMYDADQKIIGVLGVARDITKRREAEAEHLELESQLRQKYKMEAVGIMAGGMAHNFNNNLSIILGNIELSKMKLPVNSEITNCLNDAKIAVFRSRDLIKQIMFYSRQNEQNKTSLQLSLLIEETLQLLRATLPSTINLQNKVTNESLNITIHADASRLQECLINLCNNAMQAMNEIGDLTISLETEDLRIKDIPAQYDAQPGRYAKLSVTDTGCGMATETIDKIFDLFYTTKAVDEGTGVGLSTVQGIVNQHDGLIKVKSILGAGTTFELFFPVTEQPQALAPKSSKEDQPEGTERILFIDDDEMLAKLGRKMLTEMGYHVTMMTESKKALQLFSADADSFDLVITDQTMPQLTGKELIQKLKKIKPAIPTIICTGFSSKVDEVEAKKLGADAFLMKPLAMPKLLQTVRRLLDGEK